MTDLGQGDMPGRLRFSERALWERASDAGDTAVLDVLGRLSRARRLLDVYEHVKCGTCGRGTAKACPACHGKGRQ